MPDANEVLIATLSAIRSRIVHAMPDQIRAAVEPLDDQQLWWRPNESSNSIGNLILHVTGSLNHYLNRAIGGMPFDRDRDAEFAARGPIPRTDLLDRFEAMVSTAEKTLDSVTVERLGDPSPEPRMNKLVIDDLLGVVTHFSAHTAQIVWISKMLSGGSLDDIWIKTHKAHVWVARRG